MKQRITILALLFFSSGITYQVQVPSNLEPPWESESGLFAAYDKPSGHHYPSAVRRIDVGDNPRIFNFPHRDNTTRGIAGYQFCDSRSSFPGPVCSGLEDSVILSGILGGMKPSGSNPPPCDCTDSNALPMFGLHFEDVIVEVAEDSDQRVAPDSNACNKAKSTHARDEDGHKLLPAFTSGSDVLSYQPRDVADTTEKLISTTSLAPGWKRQPSWTPGGPGVWVWVWVGMFALAWTALLC
ncbi:hypothetical protein GE09DRAFT_542387 [Coniochaeta sp. 2T2.1]|nr:hypothetical protein GE09DRAFT_542387 [Coniochaeta sp. 2T2.1]